MTKRLKTVSVLVILALCLSVAEDGFAGKKKKKKKGKKKDKASTSQPAPQQEAPATTAPPKVVKDIYKRLQAYDTTAARGLLSGQQLDSSVHLRVAEGRILEQEGQYAQASARLSEAAAAATTDPAPLVFLGETHLRTRNSAAANDAFSGAERRARAILASNPNDADALFYLGVAQQRLKRYGEALSTLQAARAARPGDARVVYRIGVTMAFQKNWSGAIDTLTEAIGMSSGIAYAYYYRGLSANEAGRKDLLVNDLDRFLAMAPNAPEAEQARRILSGL